MRFAAALALSLLRLGVWPAVLAGVCFAGELPGFAPRVYKTAGSAELKLFFKFPASDPADTARPAIVFFFGGSWNRRNLDSLRPQAEHFARRGMVAVLADYRVRDIHGTTPFDALADAKSALRFLRREARSLGIDPERIVAAGGSAGGQLAAAAAMVPGGDDPADDLRISPRPAALVLFNPVLDNGPGGFGHDRIGARYCEFSPAHNIAPGAPPTVLFLGTADDGIPVATLERYRAAMVKHGNRCDLFLYEGQKHGFYRFVENSPDGNRYFHETLWEADRFLVSLGLIAADRTERASGTAPVSAGR